MRFFSYAGFLVVVCLNSAQFARKVVLTLYHLEKRKWFAGFCIRLKRGWVFVYKKNK